MKRIIAHLIRGEAGEAHQAITRDLTEKFGTFPLHDRIPPHLTLKRFFELDEKGMEELNGCLNKFAKGHEGKGGSYTLKGFGSFRKGVIYMDVLPSAEVRTIVRELMTSLHTVKGLAFDEYDDMEDDLHATVAMDALKPFDHDSVWNYLNEGEMAGKYPDYQMKFDNITILKKMEDAWVTEYVWEL